MLRCPKCSDRLIRTKFDHQYYWCCISCGGHMTHFNILRKVASDLSHLQNLKKIAIRLNNRENIKCPVCQNTFDRAKTNDVDLEVCKSCELVWFDRYKYDRFIKTGKTARTIAKPVEKKVEKNKPTKISKSSDLSSMAQYSPIEHVDGRFKPYHWSHYFRAIFGLPIEEEETIVEKLPLATWILVALTCFVSLLIILTQDVQLLLNWAFIPNQAFRYGGLTFVTSFFIHAGFLHLIGNMYFLIVFGDNVEDYLGPLRFLALIIVATIVGDLASLIFEMGSNTPHIGASGGVSGVIAFYALRFRRAKVTVGFLFFFRFFWIRFSAIAALVIWFLQQGVGLFYQIGGFSNVSFSSHIGGALVGYLAWLKWKEI